MCIYGQRSQTSDVREMRDKNAFAKKKLLHQADRKWRLLMETDQEVTAYYLFYVYLMKFDDFMIVFC